MICRWLQFVIFLTSICMNHVVSVLHVVRDYHGCMTSCVVWNGVSWKREIDMLMEIGTQIEMHTICGLADAAIWPIEGLMRSWKKEILERSKHPENYHPEDYFQKAWSGMKL